MGFHLPEAATAGGVNTSGDYVGAIVGKFGDDTGHIRIASDDPQVREDIASVYGGTFYTHTGPDGKPAFRQYAIDLGTTSIKVLIERMRVRWAQLENGTYGKAIKTSDGRTITFQDGETEPDPDAALSLKERFDRYASGRTDLALFVDMTIRLADLPEMGMLNFSKNGARRNKGKVTGVSALYALGLERKTGVLAKFEAAAEKPVPATLVNEAKEGPSGTYYVPTFKL